MERKSLGRTLHVNLHGFISRYLCAHENLQMMEIVTGRMLMFSVIVGRDSSTGLFMYGKCVNCGKKRYWLQ
jgi:hypothetical protein